MNTRQTVTIFSAAILAASCLIAQVADAGSQQKATALKKSAPRDPNAAIQSPAARPRPKPATTDTYPASQVQAGEVRFVSQCGFCHGRDAAGGESGPDLTRSELVAADSHGDKIGPLLSAGRPDAGMPSFHVEAGELQGIVAFIHTQANKFAGLGGGRRSVDPTDLATGNVADGRAWFSGAGGCSGCHSAAGDLAGVATRYQGLTLLQRMLYPSGQPAPARPKATVTLASGQTISAPLAAEDEFSIVVLDSAGARQTYSRDKVKVKIEDPMSAHFALLGKYTDAEMHNVFAYVQTLK
jgi:cytochrome c oxidase cbb3-type subunit III